MFIKILSSSSSAVCCKVQMVVTELTDADTSCGVVYVILCLAFLTEYRLVTDRQTDGRADTGSWHIP